MPFANSLIKGCANFAFAFFQLGRSDLDGIKPVSISPNQPGRRGDIRIYNLCDVRALAQRLRSRTPPDSQLQRAVGRQIVQSRAMREFGVSGSRFHYHSNSPI